MMTSTNWLDQLCRTERPLRPEPTMNEAATEAIRPGDCHEDGTISYCRGRINQGRVWLSERQAHAAAYYGWQITGHILMADDGHELHLVTK